MTRQPQRRLHRAGHCGLAYRSCLSVERRQRTESRSNSRDARAIPTQFFETSQAVPTSPSREEPIDDGEGQTPPDLSLTSDEVQQEAEAEACPLNDAEQFADRKVLHPLICR